jgi:DNA excision repair protein ERCC-3
MFREGVFKTVFLSRIGDEAIDLPNASVGIEINIHKGSRRQMLQRLGRIMRPKDCNVSSSYNAMFYTIVTDNTPEIRYFNKRRECLINLGFQYDLRFSEYGEDSMSDIFKDDNSEAKNRALSKFNEIMKNEQDFWANMNEG